MRADRRDDVPAERREARTADTPSRPDADPPVTPQPQAAAEPAAPVADPAMQSPVATDGGQGGSAQDPALATTPFAAAIAAARALGAQGLGGEHRAEPATPATPNPGAGEPATPAVPAVPAGKADAATAARPQAPAPTAGQAPTAQPGEATAQPTDPQAPVATEQQPAVPQAPATADQPAADAPQSPASDQAPTAPAQPKPGHAGEHGQGPKEDHLPKGPSAQASPVAQAATAAAHADKPAHQGPMAPATGEQDQRVSQAAGDQAAVTAATGLQAEAAPTTTTAPPRGAVALQHLARTAEAAMQLMAHRGITQARLHLHPAELGAIEIHLRHTAGGLTARLVADSSDAVTALQQAADELQRKLESAGITLQHLDIGARADQDPQARAFTGAFAGQSGDDRRGGLRGFGRAADDAGLEPAPVQTIRSRVPVDGGALLDVLA